MDTSAIILGASGSVGQALLDTLVRCARFHRIVVITRRPLGLQLGPTVEERLVPTMTPQALTQAVVEALKEQQSDAVGFSVLGVGADTAKLTIEEHRAIDVELNAAFARGLKESGRVRHLTFMSAVGADPRAKTTGSGAAGMGRYARVKGEAEEAVREHGPAVVSIFRPSVIVGSRHTPGIVSAASRLFSPLTPAKFRPIRTIEIALAMVAAALHPPSASATYHFAEMKQLIAADPSLTALDRHT